jgi:hypothetical protein
MLHAGRPGNREFLFYTVSRPALGSTQQHIQWVTGIVSPGVKRLGHEADHSPPFSAEFKNSGAIPPLPHTSSWRGNKLSTGTSLPFLQLSV